ncbi:MAG: WYL domain-containing protein [Lachnospiraceae bacterium]|nr:WYL domain-containing protein [Lachnospiraceae bacterium]
MARAANQKLKILYILKLLEQSDETHVVTMKAILGELASHGIRAERKRIYDDLGALRDFGYPVTVRRGRMAGYYLSEKGTDGLLSVSGWERKEVSAPSRERERYERFSGDTKVELSCEEGMAAVIQKELGEAVSIREKPGKKAGGKVLRLRVNPGEAFYGWLAGFGCQVRLNTPPALIKGYRKYLKEIRNLYKSE